MAQVFENEFGGAIFQLLHDLRRIGQLRRPQQNVEMFGHQDETDNPETQFLAQVLPSGHELALEALGVKEPGAAIGAGRDVVE